MLDRILACALAAAFLSLGSAATPLAGIKRFLKVQIAKWADVVKRAGIAVQ